MDDVKIIEIKKSVFADNDEDADKLRKELKGKGVYLLNLMSSPGAGKTTTLIGTLKRIQDQVRVAVMEADIDSDVDAVKIQKATGIPTIQLHTGGMCHLDAEMTRQGLDNVALSDVDLVILENVGNLVCPAEFDTGAVRNAMILSVPEGDDKPLKYPLMFSVCDLVLCLTSTSTWTSAANMSACAIPRPASSPSARRRARGSTTSPTGCSPR